jgi:glycosyltransferase involved in cell wall biosynthesis
MSSKPEVLMISKPIAPPWNDSAKNIVRDQVRNGARYTYRIMTIPDAEPIADAAIHEPVYRSRGELTAGIRQNARVMLRGLRRGDVSIYHYFFAPNGVTSAAGRVQAFVAGVRTVQTICSTPASFERAKRLLFTDRVVALSPDTAEKLERAGVDRARIRMVRPGIVPIPRAGAEERAAVRVKYGIPAAGPAIVFPGDYEFSTAADTVAAAAPALLGAFPSATLVFACRLKTGAAQKIQERIRIGLGALAERVVFVNVAPDMPHLVGAADVAVLPAESLYAKMDVPLVLLEAMSQRVPLVVADVPPLAELVGLGAAIGVPPGDAPALAAATKAMLNDVERASRLGEAGERAVNELFSSARMAREVEDIYDELLGR